MFAGVLLHCTDEGTFTCSISKNKLFKLLLENLIFNEMLYALVAFFRPFLVYQKSTLQKSTDTYILYSKLKCEEWTVIVNHLFFLSPTHPF